MFLRQVIADLRQLLDLQFDVPSNSSDSPMNLMKRISTLRQLRDPHTMNRLAQMARQRPPPPPQQLPPGRFNNFRYPPPPSTFMGAPPPPPFHQPKQQLPLPPIQHQQDPGLFFGAHHQPPRGNEREFLHQVNLFFCLFTYPSTLLPAK